MDILHSTWFTEMGSTKPIGIVIVDTGYHIKAYIGTASGSKERSDENRIAEFGARFPLDAAYKACGISE